MQKDDVIYRQAAIDAAVKGTDEYYKDSIVEELMNVPSAQPKEVTPYRNYKYLSDYWCECGWHLGKKGEVKYCSNCGRKVNWDE